MPALRNTDVAREATNTEGRTVAPAIDPLLSGRIQAVMRAVGSKSKLAAYFEVDRTLPGRWESGEEAPPETALRRIPGLLVPCGSSRNVGDVLDGVAEHEVGAGVDGFGVVELLAQRSECTGASGC